MAYYYYKDEREQMKRAILSHCESETMTDINGNRSAWRLRLKIEAILGMPNGSKRDKDRMRRALALYEELTDNDMPNF